MKSKKQEYGTRSEEKKNIQTENDQMQKDFKAAAGSMLNLIQKRPVTSGAAQ